MEDPTSETDPADEWSRMMNDMNRAAFDAFEENVRMQSQFVESWVDALEENQPSAETVDESVEAYASAYRSWMDAAEQMLERTTDALEGEDVSAEEFRDIWLETANESFKEVMGTSAFAAMTGQTVGDALELQQEADETAETTLHALGFATEGDVQEVGERLVELERRQHELESKLDRVLEAVEE